MSFLPYSQINNGISPAYSYFNIIDFQTVGEQNSLVFPGTFLPSTYYFSAYMRITNAAGITGCKVILPEESYGAPGNAAIFYNVGAENVTIVTSLMAEIVTLTPSSVWVVVLSINNTWNAFQIGATASQINAEALAGYGLVALNSKLNLNLPIINKSATFVIDSTYRASLVNWTGGSETVTLSDATTLPTGFFFYYKNNSSSLFTFNCSGAQTIDGQTNLILSPFQSCMIYTDALNWFTEGLGSSINSEGVKLTPNGIQVVSGSATVPSYSFISAQNTGLYLEGSTNIGMTVSGSKVFEVTTSGINQNTTTSPVNFYQVNNIPWQYISQIISL